jgi:predicted Zn finger-like uncharacterized protein
MRIVCPSCDAAYEVPESILAPGKRAVRCVRCGTEWTPGREPQTAPSNAEPPAPSPMQPLLDEPPPVELRRLAPPRPDGAKPAKKLASYRGRDERRLTAIDPDERPPPREDDPTRGRRVALVGWVLSLLLLVALGFGAVAWRGAVMASWPPSERLYAALGLR